ncbi:hypothetical protein Tco_1253889 [Tanacetum coccineum]
MYYYRTYRGLDEAFFILHLDMPHLIEDQPVMAANLVSCPAKMRIILRLRGMRDVVIDVSYKTCKEKFGQEEPLMKAS